jgi:filamentous hemagglutinin
MQANRGFLGALAAILVAVAIGWFAGPARMPAQAPQPSAPAAMSDAGWSTPIWVGGEENARHHWEKHGSEFPEFSSEEDYVRGVHAFLLHPPAGTLVKHRDNGDTLYFDPASDTFAVRAGNGAPRTFFRPGSGMAYWERQ